MMELELDHVSRADAGLQKHSNCLLISSCLSVKASIIIYLQWEWTLGLVFFHKEKLSAFVMYHHFCPAGLSFSICASVAHLSCNLCVKWDCWGALGLPRHIRVEKMSLPALRKKRGVHVTEIQLKIVFFPLDLLGLCICPMDQDKP